MRENNFFAMVSRMKYINRWGLMRNTIDENIAEHSLIVSVIASGEAKYCVASLIEKMVWNSLFSKSQSCCMPSIK